MNGAEFTAADLTLLRRAAVLAGAVVAITKYSGADGTGTNFRGIVAGVGSGGCALPE